MWMCGVMVLLAGVCTALPSVGPSSNTVPNGFNIGVISKASTPSGNTEVYSLYDLTYQQVTSTSATPFVVSGDNNSEVYLFGEFNHDGRPDCYVIKKTGVSGKTEVHILDGAQRYSAYAAPYNGLTSNVSTVLGSTGSNHLWEFLLGDYNNDNIPDLYAIKRLNTDSNMLIRVLNGANNFQSYLAVSTNMPGLTNSYLAAQFALGNYNADGIPDLYMIETAGESGQTALRIFNGATGYSSWATNMINTILPITGASRSNDFLVADYDGDSIPDLYQIKRCADSEKVEVHILGGADGFQSWICHGTTTVASVGANDAVTFSLMSGLPGDDMIPVTTESSSNGGANYNILNNAVKDGIRRGVPLSIKEPFLPTNNPFMWHAVELPCWMPVYGNSSNSPMLANSNFSAWPALPTNSIFPYAPPTFGTASTYQGTGGLRASHATGWYAKVWGLYGSGSVTHGSDRYGDFAKWLATSVEPPAYSCGNPDHQDPDKTGYCHVYDPAVGLWVREGTAGHDFGQVIPIPSFINGWVTVRLRLRWNSGNPDFFVRIFQGYGNNLYFNSANSKTLPAIRIQTNDHSVRDYMICFNLDAQYEAVQKFDGTGKVKYLSTVFTSSTPKNSHDVDVYYIGLTPGIGTTESLDPSLFMTH